MEQKLKRVKEVGKAKKHKKERMTVRAVRFKAEQRRRVTEIAFKYEQTESVVIRRALDFGLRDFDKALTATRGESKAE